MKNWNFVHDETVNLNEKLNDEETPENYDEIVNEEIVTAMEGIPDLELLVTGNKSGVIKFWKILDEIQGEDYLSDPKLHQGKILSIAYLNSNDKKYILTGGEDCTLVLITITDNKEWEVRKFNKFPSNRVTTFGKIIGDINSICNTYNGKHILYNIGSKIAIFNIISMEIVNIQEYQPENILNMIYLKNQNLLVYSTETHIKALNPFNSEINYSYSLDSPIVNLIYCNYNNQQSFIGNFVNSSKIIHFTFENEEFKKIKSYEVQGKIANLNYCHDKRTLIIVFKEGLFHLTNIENEQKKRKLFYDQTPLTYGCYLGDGRNIALANDEGKLEFFTCS